MTTDKTIKKMFVTLLSLNVVGVSLYCFMLYQIFSERKQTKEAVSTLTDELKKEGELRGLSGALTRTTTERQKIDKYFVDIKGSAQFLEELQSFAVDSETSIKLESAEVEGKSVLRVDFSASGSFGGIYRLMELLENTPYVTETKSMNLSKVQIVVEEKSKNTTKGSSLWSGSFSVRLLSFVNK